MTESKPDPAKFGIEHSISFDKRHYPAGEKKMGTPLKNTAEIPTDANHRG